MTTASVQSHCTNDHHFHLFFRSYSFLTQSQIKKYPRPNNFFCILHHYDRKSKEILITLFKSNKLIFVVPYFFLITTSPQKILNLHLWSKKMSRLISAPFRLATGLPIAISQTVFNIFKSDIESGETSSDDETLPKLEDYTLYDLAKPNLDLCILIYYYTELRSATKIRLKKFAEKKKLSYKFGPTPSDIEVLYNAVLEVKRCRDNLKVAISPSTAVSVYRNSLKGIEDLKDRFNLSSGDMLVLEQYFDILSREPKSNTEIKKDLLLYSDYIDLVFIKAFGGKDFNTTSVEDLVKIDDDSYMLKIDDDFITTSLNPLTAVKNIGAELVYAISISDKLKTISVIFRGSVNIQDWVQNIDCNSTECLFPGFTTARGMATIKQTPFGKVHAGFYDYLFNKTDKGRDGSERSKGEEIMGILTSLLEGEKMGYRVCFTGHSLGKIYAIKLCCYARYFYVHFNFLKIGLTFLFLTIIFIGGALSNLMAFRCASKNELKSTVYNVSVASPFVGDQTFRDHFYEMEQKKHIMHLRISNYEDLVPLIPACTYPIPDFHTYKQTGWNIKLFNKSLIHPYYNKSYPKMGDLINEVGNAVNSNVLNGFNINMFNHLAPEYHKRLEAAKDELEKFTLFDLYNSSEWTGWEYDKPGTMCSKQVQVEEKKAEEPEVAGET